VIPTKRGSEAGAGEIVYAGNTVRASKARVIEVRGNENYGHADIEIPVMGLHRVTGRVVTNTGTIVNSGIVRLGPSGEPGPSRANSLQADGSFSFDDVADEDYTIAVEFHGEAEMLGLTEDKMGVRMRMKKAPYADVSQTVRVNGQDPPAVILLTKPIT
jgi:proline racemase